jgi:polyphosphate kinase
MMDKKAKLAADDETADGGPVFLNRELSMLEFNRRVLAQAENLHLPLLERLRFLCIVSSNLDEFFEVRLASLLAQGRLDTDGTVKAMVPAYVPGLERTSEECRRIIERQYALLNHDILPRLAAAGVYLLRQDECSEGQCAWIKQYFENEVRPLLTPIGLDPAHPFPRVVNKSLNFIVELSGKDAFGRGSGIAIMRAPRVLPRVIRLPDDLGGPAGTSYCLLSSVIQAHIDSLFTGREVIACSQFRVTRNSDLWVDEEEVKNLRQALQTELRSRQYGFGVRLEVATDCPPHLADFLLDQFSIDRDRLFAVDGPVTMVRLLEIISKNDRPELLFPPFVPGLPAKLINQNVFELLDQQDVLLHHPYQSFLPVIEFVRKAAADPQVVAIKQTIYRAGMNSDLMESLIAAAVAGKEVTVVVELMARFDEEVNINWAERLEDAGAQVIYGVVGLKTHAKMALVLRHGPTGLRRYAHLGTGNYNLSTSRAYTDFGLLTADRELTGEVAEVFNHLTSLTRPKQLRHLWLAPFALHKEIVRAIENEAAVARSGKPARIIAKMNALTDETVIAALYAASEAGVKIDLIVRGACVLRPGVPRLSENIRVRSVVGRFLEHTRVYYFRNHKPYEVYLSSADWMNRNLFRRVEVAFPVRDAALRKRVINEGLLPYLKDNVDAWELNSDGRYHRRRPRGKQASHSAQQELAAALGGGSSAAPTLLGG